MVATVVDGTAGFTVAGVLAGVEGTIGAVVAGYTGVTAADGTAAAGYAGATVVALATG